MGRKTYEMALGMKGGGGLPKIKEYVFSNTLNRAKDGAVLIKGDIANWPTPDKVSFPVSLPPTSYPSNNLATPKAAPAATAPISITRRAPHQGLMPVSLLLKKPNTNKHIRVTNADIFNASVEELRKK